MELRCTECLFVDEIDVAAVCIVGGYTLCYAHALEQLKLIANKRALNNAFLYGEVGKS